ncbi:MAG: ATP-binding protein, partial [Chloroflexota bacterium]
GSGIPPEEMVVLFQPYGRTESALRSGISGTGLGLYASKQLLEAMDGRVWVESAPGRGSTFSLALALAPEANAEGRMQNAE